ncbi:hypothetical protein N8D56_19665 [Devosia sp. A8/3-2]|nr:hypothetical protein N8D56_19665 [Devosia sp. A8/3-2]
MWQSAVDWLNKAPDELPDAAEWWYERRALIRQLLNAGEPKLAYQAAAGYTKGPDGRVVEAQFHAGWIALSFLDDAAAAKQHFTAQKALSTLPDTVSQSNYWLAQADTKLGDTTGAKAAYEAAARYGNVYYGQLARAELGHKGVEISPPAPLAGQREPVQRQFARARRSPAGREWAAKHGCAAAAPLWRGPQDGRRIAVGGAAGAGNQGA